MVVLRCANCREVVIDTKKGINRITKITSYDLVFKDEIGKFSLELEPNGVKYLCDYCSHELNVDKLREKGINIETLIKLANKRHIELAKQRIADGDN